MRTFVINLPTSADRRASVEEQMRVAGREYEFFDAITGEEAMAKWFASYDETEFLISTGRRASAGEKGCYASHLALWTKCVELDAPILIMEDDFYLAPEFSDAVEAVETVIQRYGFIRLQHAERRGEVKVSDIGGFGLYRYTRMPHCTMCYALTPAVAKKFIQQSGVVSEPVDVYMKQFWKHRQPMYGLLPYTALDSVHSAESVVQDRRVTEPKPISIKLRRVGRKIAWGFMRRWTNLKYIFWGRY